MAIQPKEPLAQLHERYRRPLLTFFRRRVETDVEAEDLAQEVLLRLVGRSQKPGFDPSSSLIFTIATNLLTDRARLRRTRAVDRHVALEAHDDSEIYCGLVEELDPERVLLSKDRLGRALAALQTMPPRMREVFLLYRFDGLRQKEIAKALGISVSAVEKHLVKALRHIAEAKE